MKLTITLSLNLMRGNALMLASRAPDVDIPRAEVDGVQWSPYFLWYVILHACNKNFLCFFLPWTVFVLYTISNAPQHSKGLFPKEFLISWNCICLIYFIKLHRNIAKVLHYFDSDCIMAAVNWKEENNSFLFLFLLHSMYFLVAVQLFILKRRVPVRM